MCIRKIAKAVLRPFPRLQNIIVSAYRRLSIGKVSTDYQLIGSADVDRVAIELAESWKNEEIPERQRALVERQLKDYRESRSVPAFDALTSILMSNIPNIDASSLLEIGCSSGYYSEVLRIKGISAPYRGCDVSEAFIKLARRIYPSVPFDVEDAANLSYPSSSFDIVVSGCCILHIAEYERAISETARVCRQYAVFHRTPILHLHGPVVYTKKAYGIDTMEIHFSEQELVRLFSAYGLHVIGVNTHSISWDAARQDAIAMKTYLCRKISK